MIRIDAEREPSDINPEQLDIELREAAIPTLHSINVGDGRTDLVFFDHATNDDIASAKAIAAAHERGALDVKLYRYTTARAVSRLAAPHGINFETGLTTRLHPTCSVVVDGEVRRIDYYAQATMDHATGVVSYDDLIVREDFAYQRDAVGFARARTQTITWFRENGDPHPDTKTRVKLYEPQESLREGHRRRGNITDKLAMDLAGWLMTTQTQLANPQDRLNLGRDFMRHHKISFDMFVEAASAQILYDVRDDAEPAHAVWIDDEIAAGVTIRATILDALNIWNLPL